ncbi:MAG: c-type cytochrome [Bacteroidota bacterium]
MMNEQKYTYRVQWLVVIGASLLFLLLFGAWISEGLNKEWRKHQKGFIELLRESSNSVDNKGIEDFERGIFQLEIPHFDAVDRCISCHHGLEDPRMVQVNQPHTMHPGTFLKDHPVQDYGCTICHGGQGGALTQEDAHGQLPETHWPYPLLEQPYIQASCGKCHLTIFNHSGPDQSIEMSGMEVFLRGKTIFSREGCLGCHQARGVGGIIGPDLTQQGEKTKHEYSFQNIRGEQSISNWLKEHFKDPEMVSPGSQMLTINLDEKELEALATFVMGLSKPDIPVDYFSIAALNEFKGMRDPMEGPAGYDYLCSACHGKEGEGKNYQEYETGIPAIGNTDFLRVASEDYIRFTLEKGRSLRQMGSWATRVSGLHSSELTGISGYLKGKVERTFHEITVRAGKNRLQGKQLFDRHCVTCHGEEGKGGVAVALNQQDFLDRADNEFILNTLLRGRGNTAMPGWSNLDDAELGDLVSHIRSWNRNRPSPGEIHLPVTDLDEGALRYHFLCSRCHGEFGEGETGPAIINKDFLDVAGERYLYETIARGREHTAMFGWSSDVYNKEKLERKDIANIIGFMRSAAGAPLTYVFQGSNPGNHETGAAIFKTRCVECHGPSGEGVKGPALNNQEFLSAASNGYLMATITLGRDGTAMPSWGYGEKEYPALSGAERQHLVAYIRSWQRIRIKY